MINVLRKVGQRLKLVQKEVPEDVIRYLESVYDMQTVYKKHIKDPRNSLNAVVNDYLHEQGFWRITEEVKSLKPIADTSVKDMSNVFLLRLYFGEYKGIYCYGLSGFIKRGKKWQYIGKYGRYIFTRLPRTDELIIHFTDEDGNTHKRECKGIRDFYYQY